MITPPFANEAHHIVPEGMNIPELNEVRALHRGSHTAEYARYVAKSILDTEPQSIADISYILNDLREQLLKGTLKLNK